MQKQEMYFFCFYPKTQEAPIISVKRGWAEQNRTVGGNI